MWCIGNDHCWKIGNIWNHVEFLFYPISFSFLIWSMKMKAIKQFHSEWDSGWSLWKPDAKQLQYDALLENRSGFGPMWCPHFLIFHQPTWMDSVDISEKFIQISPIDPFRGFTFPVNCRYHLVMTNSSPWFGWPIEIDGLPINSMVMLVIFHSFL